MKKKGGKKEKENRRSAFEKFICDNEKSCLAGLLVIHLILCLFLFNPKLHTGGDNATYINLGRSLIQWGGGYSDQISPGPPKPHTQYPFGFPLLLVPFIALFGLNFIVLKFVSIMLSLLSVLIFTNITRRIYRSAPVWAVISLTFALNPVVVDYSHWILSEMPFLCFSLLSFYLFFKAESAENMDKWFWLSLVCMAFVVHIRSIGIALIGAGFIYYALKTKFGKMLYFCAGSAVLVLPWIIRNKLVQGSVTPYLSQFLLKSVYEPEKGNLGFWDFVQRVGDNLWIYSSRELPRIFVGSESAFAYSLPMKILALMLCAVLLVGLTRNVFQRLSILEVYFIIYALPVLSFEEVVSDVRYLMPLIPLIIYYIFDGVSFITAYLRKAASANLIPAAAVFLIGLTGLGSQFARIPQNFSMIRGYLEGDKYAGYPINWRQFFEAADWVRGNTPKESVVTVRKPSLFYLVSGRKVFIYPFSTNADSVLALIRATDYVVVDAVSGTTARYLVPAIQKAPRSFKLVYDKPYCKVLEVVK